MKHRRGPISVFAVIVLSGILAGAGCDSGTGSSVIGPGTGTCRSYPTSATAVTVTGPTTATVTYSGSHNAGTHQTTYNVSYSDTAGISYSYVQVTTYLSTADVVDEVKVIPPLTRSVGTTVTGGQTNQTVNSYDAQRRLTGYSTLGDSVSYSAWDASGRPTAGTSLKNGSLVISYNDSTRTSMTAYQALGTETQTYDANGNPATFTQSFNTGTSTTTTTVQLTAQICR